MLSGVVNLKQVVEFILTNKATCARIASLSDAELELWCVSHSTPEIEALAEEIAASMPPEAP